MTRQAALRALGVAVAVALLVASTATAARAQNGQAGTTTTTLAPAAGAGDTTNRGVTETSIKVGGLGNSFSFGGADIGARARFERANDTGGVNGRTIDYTGFADDGGGDPAAGTAAATKLVEQDQVFAVVPTVTPNLAGAAYLAEQKVPYFGWALSSDFCGNAYGFGFSGCLLPDARHQQRVGRARPHCVRRRRAGPDGGDRHRRHAERAARSAIADRRRHEREVQGHLQQGRARRARDRRLHRRRHRGAGQQRGEGPGRGVRRRQRVERARHAERARANAGSSACSPTRSCTDPTSSPLRSARSCMTQTAPVESAATNPAMAQLVDRRAEGRTRPSRSTSR